MYSAAKLLVLPIGLIVASSVGAVGAWAMPFGAVLMLAACVVGAMTMESREVAAAEDLSATSPRAEEPTLEAA